MNGFSILVDVAALAVSALVVIRAYKNGLLRSVVMFAGVIASVLIAVWASGWLSEAVYDSFFRQPIITGIEDTVAQGAASSVEELTERVLSLLPGFVVNPLLSSEGGEAALSGQLGSAVSGVTDGLGESIADHVVGPVAISVIQFITCLLIFLVCVIIVKIVASLFTHLRAVPVIGPVNAFLGGAVGLLQAALLLCVLGVVCRLVISMTGEGLSWLNTNVVEHTLLFRYFCFLP